MDYGYYPKNFAIIFILIIAIYTCIPLPPKICLVTGILVSIAHFAALITEYVIITNGKNEEKIDETSEYTSYMYRLVSYCFQPSSSYKWYNNMDCKRYEIHHVIFYWFQLISNTLLLVSANLTGSYYLYMRANSHIRTLERTKDCVESRYLSAILSIV